MISAFEYRCAFLAMISTFELVFFLPWMKSAKSGVELGDVIARDRLWHFLLAKKVVVFLRNDKKEEKKTLFDSKRCALFEATS